MRNAALARDYYQRAKNRILALNTLYDAHAWADVVRESQEVVELALKALLRISNIEVPRIHDVSEVLIAETSIMAKAIQKEIPRFCEISRRLRRDRELSFYGTEDLTPIDFYKEADAKTAREDAQLVVDKLAVVFG